MKDYDFLQAVELLETLPVPDANGIYYMYMSRKVYKQLKRDARRMAGQEQKRLSHKQGKRRF